MSDQSFSRPSTEFSSKRLWFGFAGAAAAWTIAEILDVIWAGRGCPRAATALLIPTETWLRIALSAITFGFLIVAIISGVTSYRNWRSLAGQEERFISAEGRTREEFMAIFGVIVSLSLAVGIVWFALPIYIITMCVRAR